MKASETLDLVTKQHCSITDLMKLLGCGRNSALKVKKQIKTKLLNDGYLIPNDILPMQAVVEILKIDIEYLDKISKYE